MKTTKLLLLALAAGLAAGTACRQEPVGEPLETPVEDVSYATLRLSLGRENPEDTRSLVSVEVEHFRNAILFAFGRDGNILTYGPQAGDLQGLPVIRKTDAETFDWALPTGSASVGVQIYTLVNYGDLDVDRFITPALHKSALDALTFSSTSPSQLKALENNGYGLPMSGIHTVTAPLSASSALSLSVKKLFAKYNLYFDLSDMPYGVHLQAMHLVVENANGEVPVFGENFAQTDRSKLIEYDSATEEDLAVLQNGGKGCAVTLYMLENCQGTKAGAESWRTVKKDVGFEAIANCTYLDLSLKLVYDNGDYTNAAYVIYLGETDMRSNFNVRRNVFKTIGLKLFDAQPVDGFLFAGEAHRNSLTVSPGEEITLPFTTSLAPQALVFGFSDPCLSVVRTDFRPNGNLAADKNLCNAGSVTVRASQDAAVGTRVRVTGGDGGGIADAITLELQEAVVLEWLVEPSYLCCPARFYFRLREGETLTGFSGMEVRHHNEGPREWCEVCPPVSRNTLVITTDQRSVTVPIVAVVPRLTLLQDHYLLPLTGASLSPQYQYCDPVTGAELPASRFDADSYSRFLAPKLTLLQTVRENLIGIAGTSFFAQDISGLGDAHFAGTAGTFFLEPRNQTEIEGKSFTVSLIKPVVPAGALPDAGTIDLWFVESHSTAAVNSTFVNSFRGDRTLAPFRGYAQRFDWTLHLRDYVAEESTLRNLDLVCPGLTFVRTSSTAEDVSYMVLLGTPGADLLAPDAEFRFRAVTRNTRTGTVFYSDIARVDLRVHLALGGVHSGVYSGYNGAILNAYSLATGGTRPSSYSAVSCAVDFAWTFGAGLAGFYREFERGNGLAACIRDEHSASDRAYVIGSGTPWPPMAYTYRLPGAASEPIGVGYVHEVRSYGWTTAAPHMINGYGYEDSYPSFVLRDAGGVLCGETLTLPRYPQLRIHPYRQIYPESGGWIPSYHNFSAPPAY